MALSEDNEDEVEVLDSKTWKYWRQLDFSHLSIEQMYYYAKMVYVFVLFDLCNGFYSSNRYSAPYFRFSMFSLNRITKEFDFKITQKKDTSDSNRIYATKIFLCYLNDLCGLQKLEKKTIELATEEDMLTTQLNAERGSLINGFSDFTADFDRFKAIAAFEEENKRKIRLDDGIKYKDRMQRLPETSTWIQEMTDEKKEVYRWQDDGLKLFIESLTVLICCTDFKIVNGWRARPEDPMPYAEISLNSWHNANRKEFGAKIYGREKTLFDQWWNGLNRIERDKIEV